MNKRIWTVKCRSSRNILSDVLLLEAAPYLQGRVVRPCSWYLHIIIFNFYDEQNTNLFKLQGSFNIQKRNFLNKIRGIVWEEIKLIDRLGKKYIRIKRDLERWKGVGMRWYLSGKTYLFQQERIITMRTKNYSKLPRWK